ncbi:MAG: CopG family transcriptional regulator [Chloroflexi bacterium]|nr:CopG family transcriptional regulator [Chloroflexota bacterium]
MIRTQISFEPGQFDELQAAARGSGISMAALVRQAVGEKLARSGAERERIKRRALSSIGMLHGGGENVSEEHDRYLDEAYGTW